MRSHPRRGPKRSEGAVRLDFGGALKPPLFLANRVLFTIGTTDTLSVVAFDCTSPAAVRYEALCAHIRVRCRRCDQCLKARQWLWRKRAAREQVNAKRTWFVTLTFNRGSRARILEAASQHERNASQQTRLSVASGWFVSTFTKRLRKSGFEVRYLFIAEPHADGFPHWHGIIHDQRGNLSSKVVYKRDKKTGLLVPKTICPDLERTWSGANGDRLPGWIDTELVRDGGAIGYVTKYMAKGRYGRVRASLAYGGAHLIADEQMRDKLLAREERFRKKRKNATTMFSNDDAKREKKEFVDGLPH